ncbi:GNAT family N-acetyltransferase [Neolewinella sp.]|uniref:GNAT family N-acetyltransferase n=1 Tax=Neolewinella sp. TaxID=2993543 RepID=UPI003B51F333
MTFRFATPADEEAIIALLRLSLGDGSTEKSVAFWRWKHVHNPFGPSPVLLAVEDTQVVGVRAFMRWDWADGTTLHHALRAVDTATHPDYRGRGIFKKLTLQLVEQCEREGYAFIFNTPNAQSRPGYLKMGWQQLGKVPLRIAPRSPLRILRALLRRGATTDQPADVPNAAAFDQVPEWLNEVESPAGRWTTPAAVDFLRWRYAECPVRDYAVLSGSGAYYLVYYLRRQRVGVELRIVHATVRQDREADARAGLAGLLRRVRPAVVSCAPASWLPWYFLPALPLGLVLTFRGLKLAQAVVLARWRYTLGDLELF